MASTDRSLGLDFNGTDAEEQGGYLYTCLTANGTRLHPSETVPEKPGRLRLVPVPLRKTVHFGFRRFAQLQPGDHTSSRRRPSRFGTNFVLKNRYFKA